MTFAFILGFIGGFALWQDNDPRYASLTGQFVRGIVVGCVFWVLAHLIGGAS